MIQESDGLHKLTEYMNQIRKQSEHAIDFLNTRVHDLEIENQQLKELSSKYKDERDVLKSTVEQLKLENNAKWKFQERDDWKALVGSLQADRDRLRSELSEMESRLEIANNELTELRLGCSRDDTDTDTEAVSLTNTPPESPTSSSRDTPTGNVLRTNTALNRDIGDRLGSRDRDYEVMFKELQEAHQELQQREQLYKLETVSLREQFSRLKEENHHLKFNGIIGLPPGTYNGDSDANQEHLKTGEENSNWNYQKPVHSDSREKQRAKGWFGMFNKENSQTRSSGLPANVILHV